MKKQIVISIILTCVFGCGNDQVNNKHKDLEEEKQSLSLQLQEQSNHLESTSDVIMAVTSLIKNIEETEMKIEEGKQRLSNADDVEKSVSVKEEILSSIQGLYDELQKHRKKARELQVELDSFVARNSKINESLSSLKTVIKEKALKINSLEKIVDQLKKQLVQLINKQKDLTQQISSYEASVKDKTAKIIQLNSELVSKEQVISTKDLEIRNLHQEINTIYYMIGNRKELRNKDIIKKEGMPVISSLNPFRKSYVLGPNCTLSQFKKENKARTRYRVDGKIMTLLPYRNKEYYDIYYQDGVSVINIKDPRNFWYLKYLVIVTN